MSRLRIAKHGTVAFFLRFLAIFESGKGAPDRINLHLQSLPFLIYYFSVMQPFGYGHVYGRPAEDPLDAVFAALADPTRRAILARLAQGDASVQELAEPFRMTQPAVSKHLRVLENAGLITRGRDAQRRPRRLEAKPMAVAAAWLAEYRAFWEARYARLDDVLAALVATEKRPQHRRKDQIPPSSSSRKGDAP